MAKVIYKLDQELLERFPEFKTFEVYGSLYDPLYLEEDVMRLSGCSQINNEFQIDKDYMVIKTNQNETGKIALTERGLYAYISRSKNEKFKDFMFELIKRIKHECKIELNVVLEELKLYERSQRKLIKEKIKLEQRLEQKSASQLKNDRSPEYYLFRVKQKFMKPISVFLESVPKDMKDEFDYNIDKEPEDDVEMLYSLGTADTRAGATKVAEVYVMSETTIMQLYKHFRERGFLIPDTYLLKISLSDLKDEINDNEIAD